jgi:tetratricopeptide (TPR) repeat protein
MQRGNKAFIWLFLFLVAASLLLLLAFRKPGTNRWEDMETRIHKLKTEVKLRKAPRAPLHGKLVEGNAWQEYDAAIKTMSDMEDGTGSIYAQFVNGTLNEKERAKVLKLIADRTAAIESLRKAAQLADGQYPYNWDAGRTASLPSLLGSRKLVNLAVAQAHILAEDGKTQEAVDLLLDATAFGRDLSTNAVLLSELIGDAVYVVSLTEMGQLVRSGKLSKDQLIDLAKKLEIVERDVPSFSTGLSNETMLFGTTALELADVGGKEWLGLIKNDWGMLFFPRSRLANAFEEKESLLRRIEKLEPMSFDDAKKEANAIDASARTSSNFLVRRESPEISRILDVRREMIAMLRVVRAAAIFRATGQVPSIPDPLGDKLLFKKENGKTKIWSLGRDGKNQNGSGAWEEFRPDIVIEIPD